MAELYNEGLFRKGLVRTSGLVRPDLLLTFDDIFSPYAIDRLEAALALDFDSNVYRTGNKDTTFADAFMGNSPKLTYNPGSASSSQSTMVNSSGNIVWAPHNLLDYSEDFSQWTASNTDVDPVGSDVTTAPDGTTAATKVESTATFNEVRKDVSSSTGGSMTLSCWFKKGSSASAQTTLQIRNQSTGTNLLAAKLNLDTGNITYLTGSSGAAAVEGLNGWWLFTITTTFPAGNTLRAAVGNAGYPVSSGDFAYIWGAHLYRSDLGGVAPVPGAATGLETYVPTNGAVEYLPRVGHHVYNGSTWVNEGLLIESEPRTNLLPSSQDLTDTSWGPTGIPTPTAISDGPYGLPAFEVTGLDTSGDRLDYTSGTAAQDGDTYTYSCWLKGSGVVRITVNTSTGVGGSNEIPITLTDEWVRHSVTHTFSSPTGNVRVHAVITRVTGTAPTVYIAGPQLEAGSTPSSYIPTSGSTVTRGGQSLTVPANWYDVDNPTPTGPELWTTPTITDDDVWQWDGSTLTGTGDGTSDSARGDVVTAGGVYRITYNVTRTSGLCQIRIGNTFIETVGATGLRERIIVAGDTTGLTVTDSGSFVGSFDNISVRQVSAPQFGWPEPEYIGPELVTNSGFNTDTSGWTSSDYSVSISSNSLVASYNGTTFGTILGATQPLVAGKVYQLSYEVIDASQVSFFRLGSAHNSVTLSKVAGTHTAIFVQATNTSNISIYADGIISGESFAIDNISVREINPLSVSIQMDGRMTYADDGASNSLSWWLWNGTDDIWAYYATDGAYDRTKFQQASDVAQNASGSQTEYLFSPGNLVPFNIAGRFGSTFVNGAVDGVALTADTTPTALPDLSNTDLQIAHDYMGTIGTFRQFAGDVGDTGLVTATNPSTEPTLSLTFDGTEGSFYNLNWSE